MATEGDPSRRRAGAGRRGMRCYARFRAPAGLGRRCTGQPRRWPADLTPKEPRPRHIDVTRLIEARPFLSLLPDFGVGAGQVPVGSASSSGSSSGVGTGCRAGSRVPLLVPGRKPGLSGLELAVPRRLVAKRRGTGLSWLAETGATASQRPGGGGSPPGLGPDWVSPAGATGAGASLGRWGAGRTRSLGPGIRDRPRAVGGGLTYGGTLAGGVGGTSGTGGTGGVGGAGGVGSAWGAGR
jgi:hypothetical protein